jgi:hypothetical protein
MTNETTPEQTPATIERPDEKRELNENEVKAILERARQNVKPLIKQESEGEVVGSDLLNFRMRSCH